MKIYFTLFLSLLLFSCNQEAKTTKAKEKIQKEKTDAVKKQVLTALNTKEEMNIDGLAKEVIWKDAKWQPLQQLWIGQAPSKEDYQGRFKLAWSESEIYILAEIQDDTLIDIHPDGLDRYWDDDCLEIFIDEDASGGDHQYNHNAFAYHIALDGKVVDVNPDSVFTYYNDHLISKRTQIGNTSTWEVAMKVFDDTYIEGGENKPTKLSKDKKVGFALAYCDNDNSAERENFMGSVFVPGEDKNQGWKDAGIFGHLVLESRE